MSKLANNFYLTTYLHLQSNDIEFQESWKWKIIFPRIPFFPMKVITRNELFLFHCCPSSALFLIKKILSCFCITWNMSSAGLRMQLTWYWPKIKKLYCALIVIVHYNSSWIGKVHSFKYLTNGLFDKVKTIWSFMWIMFMSGECWSSLLFCHSARLDWTE